MSAAEIGQEPNRRMSPTPLNSLVASAQRITSTQVKERRGFGKPEAWQDDAWDMYDLVGEQRFLATTLAGRLGQANFYVGKINDDPIEPPEPLDTDEHIAAHVFSYFGDSPMARAQMIVRMGVNLFVPGDGYFVGIPRWMMPNSEVERPDDTDPALSLDDLEWRMLSVSEVSQQNGAVVLKLGEAREEQIVCDADDIFLIRVWRPHPRKWWQADSPTRSSLGVLRELVGLTMHISAQVDSRLAGAGILVVPASAKRAIAVAAGIDPDSDEDPFTEALMEAMMTAIQDRSNASALVPLVVTVPDESTGLFQHITFATPLDQEARNLRDEAIRRLALGQDAPPELLLGVGGLNHWGAWLVREDVVTTHIEPPLALICDAITTQFLWPVLIEQGMDEDEAHQYVIWYDVGHMVQRPNRLQDANLLHDKGVLSDETLREAAGFGDQDAPTTLSEPVRIAVEMAKANPALVDNMAEIVAAFEAILNPATAQAQVEQAEDVIETGGEVTEEDTAEEGTPETDDGSTEDPPALAASAGPLHLGNVMDRAMQGDPVAIALAIKVLGHQARLLGLDPEYTAAEHDWVLAEEPDADLDEEHADPDGDNGMEPEEYTAGTTTFAPDGFDTDTSVVIVALPENDQDLPGPEEEKHATLLYLGHIGGDGAPNLPEHREFLASVVNEVAKRTPQFTAQVKGVEPLGDEGATVWMLDSPEAVKVRERLMIDEVEGLVEDGTFTKYPEFLPHVTIGYPHQDIATEDIEEAEQVTSIRFDRIALWWGTERIEFPFQGSTPPNQRLADNQGMML